MSEEHERIEIAGDELLPFSYSSGWDSIHQIFYQGQNWYRVVDVIDVLEVAKDPADYWSGMKRRIRTEGFNAARQEMVQFELKSPKDRRLRKHDYATRQTILSPYELAVAEILLQRTTAAGVARAFPGLIALYPTWEAMAGTSLENLQEALRPLGLWRQKAQALLHLSNIVEKQGGELPCSRRDLERLPGIGPYTASAVMAAVYGLHEPLVDVNMARVLGRFFGSGSLEQDSLI